MEAKTEYQESPWFADKDVEIEFQKEEKTMIAVHVLIIMCSILEIILTMASVQPPKPWLRSLRTPRFVKLLYMQSIN